MSLLSLSNIPLFYQPCLVYIYTVNKKYRKESLNRINIYFFTSLTDKIKMKCNK